MPVEIYNISNAPKKSQQREAVQRWMNLDILTLVLQFVVMGEGRSRFTRSPYALVSIIWLSHVCRHWRQFILASASIWSKVIDLTVLGKMKNPLFPVEILSRSGALASLPLYIYGKIALDQKIYKTVFLELLGTQWHRIKVFNVEVQVKNLQNTGIFHSLWKTGAPILEEFQLGFKSSFNSVNDQSTTLNLFDNHAPYLQIFSCPRFQFDCSANWVKQVRVLDVGVSVWEDLLRWFRAPQDLQQLESLMITGPSLLTAWHTEGLESLPQIALPRLSVLSLRGSLGPLVKLLSKITTSPRCRLKFSASNDRVRIQDLSRTQLDPVLRSTGASYFPDDMDELDLLMDRMVFKLRGQSSGVSKDLQVSTIDFQIHSQNLSLSDETHSHIFRPVISLWNFNAINRLRLDVADSHRWSGGKGATSTCILFFCLPGLTELGVSFDELQLLGSAFPRGMHADYNTEPETGSAAYAQILPSLCKIELFSKPRERYIFCERHAQQTLVDVLLSHRHQNLKAHHDSGGSHPLKLIKYLDITEYTRWHRSGINYTEAFEFLAQVPGLEVVCRNLEPPRGMGKLNDDEGFLDVLARSTSVI